MLNADQVEAIREEDFKFQNAPHRVGVYLHGCQCVFPVNWKIALAHGICISDQKSENYDMLVTITPTRIRRFDRNFHGLDIMNNAT